MPVQNDPLHWRVKPGGGVESNSTVALLVTGNQSRVSPAAAVLTRVNEMSPLFLVGHGGFCGEHVQFLQSKDPVALKANTPTSVPGGRGTV